MKKITALVVSIMLTIGMLSIVVSADDATKNVTLRIEGANDNIYYGTEAIVADTVADALVAFDELSDEFSLDIVEGQYGAYINGVNDEAAAAFGGWDGWLFMVNGVESPVGIDATEIKDNDVVVLYYADPYGVGFQKPELDTDKLVSDGIIKFVSNDVSYDDAGEPHNETNPVVGAKVRISGLETQEYTTDENGEIVVDFKSLAGGEYGIAIEKYSDAGIPLVLRFAPDTKLVVPEDPNAGEAALNASVVLAMLFAAAAFVTIYTRKESYEK